MHIRLITCCGLLCGVALGSLGLASGCGGPDRPQALAPEEAQRARKKMMEAMRKGISGGMGKTKAAKSKMLRSLEKM